MSSGFRSSQVGSRVSGWLSHGHVIFSLPLPPFLTLFHSVSLFHTFRPTVADTCLRNASDRCLSCSASQLHLGHLFNLRQPDAPPHPLHVLFCPSFACGPLAFLLHRVRQSCRTSVLSSCRVCLFCVPPLSCVCFPS